MYSEYPFILLRIEINEHPVINILLFFYQENIYTKLNLVNLLRNKNASASQKSIYRMYNVIPLIVENLFVYLFSKELCCSIPNRS